MLQSVLVTPNPPDRVVGVDAYAFYPKNYYAYDLIFKH